VTQDIRVRQTSGQVFPEKIGRARRTPFPGSHPPVIDVGIRDSLAQHLKRAWPKLVDVLNVKLIEIVRQNGGSVDRKLEPIPDDEDGNIPVEVTDSRRLSEAVRTFAPSFTSVRHSLLT
jgi:hypothetical protein